MLTLGVMKRDPFACLASDSLNVAAQIMWEHDCGFVPVIAAEDDRRVVGVITDRDICMCAYTRGTDLRSQRVADAMSTHVYRCTSSTPTSEAESTMKQAKVRRLPVVDDDGKLVGVLSLSDLARMSKAVPNGNHGRVNDISESEVGELVRAICQPRELGSEASA